MSRYADLDPDLDDFDEDQGAVGRGRQRYRDRRQPPLDVDDLPAEHRSTVDRGRARYRQREFGTDPDKPQYATDAQLRVWSRSSNVTADQRAAAAAHLASRTDPTGEEARIAAAEQRARTRQAHKNARRRRAAGRARRRAIEHDDDPD